MKISKYVKLVKECGFCAVYHVGGSGIWLGTRAGIYRATELPDMTGEDQIRTVLDVPEKAWNKIVLREEWFESVKDVLGLNLGSYADGEQETEKLKMMAAPHGLWCSCCRRNDSGEMIFYQEGLLSPLADQIKDSDYIKLTARETAEGQPYLVVQDGFDIIGAIMPYRVLSEEYLADLSEFLTLCTEQFCRERERERSGAGTAEEAGREMEQIGMDEEGAGDA